MVADSGTFGYVSDMAISKGLEMDFLMVYKVVCGG